MARIQLRNTHIYIVDGTAGTFDVNQVAGIVDTDTTCTVDGVAVTAAPAGHPTVTEGATDVLPIGARFVMPVTSDGTVFTITGRTPSDGSAATTDIVFSPAANAANTALDNATITVLPQRIAIKIGDGDMSWTEAQAFEYDLNRGRLDTVRQADDVPVSVELAFTFEYVTSESGQAITPVEALKQKGAANEWRSSSSDQCEPYAVDLYVIHDVQCGTDQDEDFLFQDFRWEALDYSIADAAISVSGQCNTTEVVTTRAASFDFSDDNT